MNGRRVSRAQLAALLQRHGGGSDGLNLAAASLGLSVLEVQRLLAKHRINAGGSGRSSGTGSSSGTSSSSDDDTSEDSDVDKSNAGAGGKRGRHQRGGKLKRSRPAAAATTAAATPATAAAATTGGTRRLLVPSPAVPPLAVTRGEVPEPQPLRLLGFLQALQRSHDADGRCVTGD
jgi:hypothetical protein